MRYIPLSSRDHLIRKNENGYTRYGPPYTPNSELQEMLLKEVMNNRSSKIHKLLGAKVDPNFAAPYNGNYPLHYAAKFGNIKIVKQLLLAGADMDKRNSIGQTPLMVASRSTRGKNTACVKMFLKSNSNCVNTIDQDGGTALQQAILSSNKDAVKLLLRYGAELNWEEKMIVFERHEHLSVGLALAKGVKDIIIGSDLVGIGQYHRHEYPRASLIYIWRKLTMKQLHKSDKIVKILDYESKKAVKEAVKDGANGAEG